MKFFETSKYYTLKKSTYISLRWIAIIGQLISINLVYFYFNFNFNFFLSNFIIFLGAISNLYLVFIYNKTQLSDRSALIFLIIDITTLPTPITNNTDTDITTDASSSAVIAKAEHIPKT